MSYILDALRRADAQRERDPARGIHAQPRLPETAPRRPATDSRPLRWGGAVLGVVALGASTAYLLWPETPQPGVGTPALATAPASARQAQSEPAAAQPVPLQAIQPAAVLLPPAPPPAPVRATAARAASPSADPDGEDGSASDADRRANTTATAARAPAAPVAARGAAPTLPATAGGTAAAAATTPAAPAQPPTPAGPAVPARRTAPAAAPAPLQDPPPGLPPLVVTGGVFSANPAQRMLIVNGQVFNEGAQPAPGVMLEEIRSGSAVLSFGGSRFAVRY